MGKVKDQSIAVFDDYRNITYRGSKLIWAEATEYPIYCSPQLAGWVIPGGRRTTDRNEAFDAVMAMHRMETA